MALICSNISLKMTVGFLSIGPCLYRRFTTGLGTAGSCMELETNVGSLNSQ